MSTKEDGEVEIKGLKRCRGGHKSYTTGIIKETEGILGDVDAEGDALEKMKAELEINLQVLEERMGIIKDLDEQILQSVDDDDAFQAEMNEAGDYQRRILQAKVAITRWQKKVSSESKPTIKSKMEENAQAKLPKIKLKQFNGDPMTFQSFWDCFESAVHKKSSLDEVTKFNYLKGLLEGKAQQALEGLTLSAENYHHAIELLTKRFGDPQVIITAHMDALLAIVPVHSNKVSELRDLCDLIEIHTRNLQSFEICANNYGPMLISIIMSKLPNEMKLELSRKMPQGKWDINKLMDAFKDEILSRERCTVNDDIDNEMKYSQASTLHVQGKGRSYNRDKFKYNPTCTFCKGSHASNKCEKVPDVESRKVIVRQKNKCFVCLKGSHIARECYSKRLCYICKGKHHISLCGKAFVVPVNKDDQENKSSTVNATVVSTNKNILLQTALAVARKDDKTRGLNVRVLFDNCAQKSFIRSDIRNKLKLPTIRTEELTVNVFASSEDKLQKLDIVQLTLVNPRSSSKCIIEAFVVPTICSKLCNQTINAAREKYEALYELELADTNNNSDTLDIEVLVGANHYWEFVTGNIVRCNGLVAVESILGWLLNGNVEVECRTSYSKSCVVKTHVTHRGRRKCSFEKSRGEILGSRTDWC